MIWLEYVNTALSKLVRGKTRAAAQPKGRKKKQKKTPKTKQQLYFLLCSLSVDKSLHSVFAYIFVLRHLVLKIYISIAEYFYAQQLKIVITYGMICWIELNLKQNFFWLMQQKKKKVGFKCSPCVNELN